MEAKKKKKSEVWGFHDFEMMVVTLKKIWNFENPFFLYLKWKQTKIKRRRVKPTRPYLSDFVVQAREQCWDADSRTQDPALGWNTGKKWQKEKGKIREWRGAIKLIKEKSLSLGEKKNQTHTQLSPPNQSYNEKLKKKNVEKLAIVLQTSICIHFWRKQKNVRVSWNGGRL